MEIKLKYYRLSNLILFFLIIFILIFFINVNLEAQTIPSDKVLHFFVSFTLGMIDYRLIEFYCLNNNIFNLSWDDDNNFYSNLLISSIISFIPGLLKEIYDSTKPDNFFDFYDLIADIAGILFADLICYINYITYINYYSDKNRNINTLYIQIIMRF